MLKRVYAVVNTNYLTASSSGGAFLLLAKAFFSKYQDKARVVAVEFDDDLNPVFGVADSFDECFRFCGSKYVYAKPSNCLKKIEALLKEQFYILFVGTPCHLSSLYNYIEKHNINGDRLFTVDLICNGAPNDKFWRDYLLWLEKKFGSKVVFFNFRKKGDIHNPYMTEIKLADGRVISDTNYTACYNQMFLKKLSIQRGCFNCSFKNSNRLGDVTIGDFWGIENIMPWVDSSNGVSEVIINTKRGYDLFSYILNNNNNNVQIVECQNNDFLKFQANLVKKTQLPKDYLEFESIYKNKGIDSVIRKYSDGGNFGRIKYPLRRMLRNIGISNKIRSISRLLKREET